MQARPLVLVKGPALKPCKTQSLPICRSEPPSHAHRARAANLRDQAAPAAASATGHHYEVTRTTATLPADNAEPAIWQRMLPALPMILPITEGLWRLACMLAGHLQQVAVDIMAFSQLQGATIAANLQAVQAVDPARAVSMLSDMQGQQRALAWAQQLYQDTGIILTQLGVPSQTVSLSNASANIAQFWHLPGTSLVLTSSSPPLVTADASGAAIGCDDVATFITDWLTRNWGTSEAWWSLGWGAGLLLVAGLAAQQTQGKRHHTRQQDVAAQAAAHSWPAWLQLLQPQLVLTACWAALLLRLSWTPLHLLSMSARVPAALDLLAPAVVGLTMATTYTAIMYFAKVLLAVIQPVSGAYAPSARPVGRQDASWLCADMVSGSVLLAGWHRTLAACDVLYVVLLATLPLTLKFQAAAAFILYSLGLDWAIAQAQACASGWGAGVSHHGGSSGGNQGKAGLRGDNHRKPTPRSSWMDG